MMKCCHHAQIEVSVEATRLERVHHQCVVHGIIYVCLWHYLEGPIAPCVSDFSCIAAFTGSSIFKTQEPHGAPAIV